MRAGSYIRAAVLPLLAAAVFPLTGAAQQNPDRAARADALFERAAAMETAQADGFNRHIRRVAGLYLKSASLRPQEDPMRIEALNRAGRYLYIVNPRQAEKVLEQAAELALIHGNPSKAAHAFLDAAVANDAQPRLSEAERATAHHFVHTARLLADSPVLEADQRADILRRIRTTNVAMR